MAADNASFDRAGRGSRARLLASTLYSLPARQSLLRLLSTERFDVAYVHNTVPLLTGSIFDALRQSETIVVQHLHNYRAFCLNSYALRDGRPCDQCVRTAFTACAMHRCYRGSLIASATLSGARLIDCARGRRTGSGAHAYIACSAFAKQQHVRHGFPEERVWVLHNASEDLAAALEPRAAVPAARRKKITFVGSLLRAKGVYAVLDLAETMPDWEVQFIGDGPENADLRRPAAARRLRNVHFSGLLVGPAKALAWHDSFVTVAPSLWNEPFPLVIGESYSLAIPVLSTGAGGMAESIRDGATGFIRSFRDSSETAELLCALWNDEARHTAMRREARRLFETEFAEQVFSERLAALQVTILDSCRGAGR
jgi:glycosyltransferase involved in cell wall biosynthesis